MLLLSQIALLAVSLLVPVIVLSVYAYYHEGGWRVVLWGCLSLIIVQLTLRLVSPLLFGQTEWYTALVKSGWPYLLVYALFSACLEIALFAFALRFRLQSFPRSGDACMLGFSYGAMEGALFIGFNTLASLMSDFSSAQAPVSAYVLAMGEVAAMLVIHSLLALWVKIGLQKPWKIVLAVTLQSAILFAGAFISAFLPQMRGFFIIGLLVMAIIALLWLYKQGILIAPAGIVPLHPESSDQN